MNEFQAILTEIIFFGLRFAIPAALIYTYARVARRISEPETKADAARVAR